MFLDVITRDFGRVSQQVVNQNGKFQVTVCVEVGDLDLVGRADNLLPLLSVVEGCIQQNAEDNTGLIVVDLRNANNFSMWFLLPLVQWIKKSRQTFETKLNFSQVVVAEDSIWTSIFKRLFRMVNTSRPVHLTTEVNTPERILDMLSSS